jgi:MinD-like ATPase involved in chromosome partitioning or flagellar assembly
VNAPGEIVTFYSYKGGTGRSMALANVAWILAANGKRVLVIDWDFEAPGLHRYFLPFLEDPDLQETQGLLDLLWDYVDMALTSPERRPVGMEDLTDLAVARRHAVPLEFPFESSEGCVHFLSAGRQTPDYAGRVQDFDWQAFYERWGGEEFLDAFRQKSKEAYDYVLIDSRTGLSDTSGICTMQMPDTVVLCFTYNRQSIKGVEAVAYSISKNVTSRAVRLLPIPLRVELSSRDLLKPAKTVARRSLDRFLPKEWDHSTREDYWDNCEIAHYTEYAVQEKLAAFQEKPKQRSGLLADLLWLTGVISRKEVTSMLELAPTLRNKYNSRAAFDDLLAKAKDKQEQAKFDVFLAYNSADKQAVVAIAKQLRSRGLRPWLDIWELRPGQSFVEALEDVITEAGVLGVVVGPTGIGPWHDAEMRAFIGTFVKHERPVIPIYLPGSRQATPDLPPLLQDYQSVSFSKSVKDEDALATLVWGITGRRPEP